MTNESKDPESLDAVLGVLIVVVVIAYIVAITLAVFFGK